MVTLAHISDPHVGSPFFVPNLMNRVIAEINEMQPDAVVCSGDLTAEGYRQEYKNWLAYAERIEAPLLILHGRKDKRVVPLMTERMVEALEIEGKHHEVHWYDEEGHGWEKRENRRDAFGRIVAFLKKHVLDETEPETGP